MAKIDNMLLRIRAETLRLNLAQASSTLESLPILSEELKEAHGALDEITETAETLARRLGQLRDKAVGDERLTYKDLRAPQSDAEDIGERLKEIGVDLREIENNSFIAQVGSGKEIAANIGIVATNLTGTVAAIQGDIGDPGKLGAAWQKLGTAWEQACGQVFSESIELLGGIALRDARLDANICELADELIKTIYPFKPARAIPGGVASIIMTSERVIRLPFPQWSIWALPLAAHELFQMVLKKNLWQLEEIEKARASVVAVLGAQTADRCLADVFATYTLGPAYAYAAIIQLFDPTRLEDEARLETILTTLAGMNPTQDESAIDSYLSEANWLRSEWATARGLAFTATALRDDRLEAQLLALRDLNPAAGTPEGEVYLDAIVKLRTAWHAAWRTAGSDAGAGLVGAEAKTLLQKLSAAAAKALKGKEIPSFRFAEWLPLQDYATALVTGKSDAIEEAKLAKLDLRHALNAAWLARVDCTRPADLDLTLPAMSLAKKIMALARKNRAPARPGAAGLMPFGALGP